jgi:hypothetical protein
MYTYWRNQARTQRRMGRTIPRLEQQAKDAAKEYHDAIRKQKKIHWNDFLADDTNIWQAAKYLDPCGSSTFDKIPPLTRRDGSSTKDKAEQAEELLSTFFPPLPVEIEDEGRRPQRASVLMPRLTIEEVERRIFAAKSWKAPGDDGLPAIVWKQVWPVVKERVLRQLQSFYDFGRWPPSGITPGGQHGSPISRSASRLLRRPAWDISQGCPCWCEPALYNPKG